MRKVVTGNAHNHARPRCVSHTTSGRKEIAAGRETSAMLAVSTSKTIGEMRNASSASTRHNGVSEYATPLGCDSELGAIRKAKTAVPKSSISAATSGQAASARSHTWVTGRFRQQ